MKVLGCLAALSTVLLMPGLLAAQGPLPEEEIGKVEPFDPSAHDRLVWVADSGHPYIAEGRAHLVNPETGEYTAMIGAGYWFSGFVLPDGRRTILSPETHFSRTTRGERTDIVAIYDSQTLRPNGEIVIPPKRTSSVIGPGLATMTDDERFLAIMNFTPAVSVSIVDLETKRFVGEYDTPGCPNIYGGGDRSIHLLCGDGSFLTLTLDDNGGDAGRSFSDELFDSFEDPIAVSGVRDGATWTFVSLDGYVHTFAFGPEGVEAGSRWSLFSDGERGDDWRISGFQNIAFHRESGRLYVLTHQGPPETFEDPGTHIFVYDLAAQERLDEFELEDLGISIAISQGDAPLLYVTAAHIPIPTLSLIWMYVSEGEAAIAEIVQFGLDVYEAERGERVRSVANLGNAPMYIQPW